MMCPYKDMFVFSNSDSEKVRVIEISGNNISFELNNQKIQIRSEYYSVESEIGDLIDVCFCEPDYVFLGSKKTFLIVMVYGYYSPYF